VTRRKAADNMGVMQVGLDKLSFSQLQSHASVPGWTNNVEH